VPDGSDVRQIQDAFNLVWKLVAALRGTPGQLAELTVLNASIGELADDPDPSVRAQQYRPQPAVPRDRAHDGALASSRGDQPAHVRHVRPAHQYQCRPAAVGVIGAGTS
jgi:hypothetical protein